MENKIVKFNDFNNKERIEVETLGVEYVENNTRIPQVFPVFLESEFKKVLKEKNCTFAFGNYIIEEKDYRLMIFNINLVGENGKIIGKTISFAGKPNINAIKIVPSIPTILAKGSKKSVQ